MGSSLLGYSSLLSLEFIKIIWSFINGIEIPRTSTEISGESRKLNTKVSTKMIEYKIRKTLIQQLMNSIYYIRDRQHCSFHLNDNQILIYNLFLMPWFQSSKDKQFRLLIEGKMDICLNKPDKYEQAFPVLDSLVRKPNQKAIEMIVDHIKQVIKDEDLAPLQKLQAMKLLRDLMQSQSKPLGKYVVKKILKRLTIFAQHRKNQKGEERGANIFKCKKSQQKYGIQFLKILLQCLSDWGQNWPRNADGPFHDFHSAFNELLMQKQVSFPKDVKKANKSPIPKTGFRNSRPQQSSKNAQIKTQTPIYKPQVITKQKKPLKKPQAQYINQMIQMLSLLSETLRQNQQLDQTWTIIKAYAENFKTIDQKGNFIVSQLIENGQRNEQLEKAIQNNSNFIAGLDKMIKTVDNKNQVYPKFNKQYVGICNNLIASLSKFNQKSSTTSFAHNNASTSALKTPNETSINQRFQQKPKERPLAQAGDNRYGSANQLKNQLELNFRMRRQDFNSGTLSRNNQNSQRGIQAPNNPNRNSMTYNNSKQFKQKQVNGSNEQRKSNNQQQRRSSEEDKKQQLNNNPQQKQKKLKQISKITEKNQNESQNNFSKFEISKQDSGKDKQKFDGSFRDFQIQNPKVQKQDSNSNFFNQLDKKGDPKLPTEMRRNRKVPKKQQISDYFNHDVKSKKSLDDMFSGFQKSKSKDNSQSFKNQIKAKQLEAKNSNQQFSNSKGFDTFKSPNQISKAMQQIRHSKKSQKSQISNPLDQKRSFGDNNNKGNNSFNKQIQRGNPFLTKQFQNNPFATYDDRNPFKTEVKNTSKISRQWNDSQSKSSVSNNPFSQKGSEKGSKNLARPPIDRVKTQKSQGGNPFQTISQPSKRQVNTGNPFETQKSQNPFGNSFISSKSFQRKQKNLGVLRQESDQKSLSQRGSFKDPKSIEVASIKNQSSIKNPFQILPGLAQNSKINFNQNINKKVPKNIDMQQKKVEFQGFDFNDFMDKSSSKSGKKSQTGKVQQKQSLEKSNFSGFDFDAFGNVNNSRNNSAMSKQTFSMKNKVQQNKVHQVSKQSSFDFFKSDNIKKQPSAQKDDFFASRQIEKNRLSKQSNQSKMKQKNNVQQQSKKSFGQFNFQDFKNVSKSSIHQKSSSLNPFSSDKNNSQPNKQNTQQYGFDDFKNINEQSSSAKNPFSVDQKSKQEPNNQNVEYPKPEIRVKSNQSEELWKNFGKNSINESDQWKKFADYKQKSINNQQVVFNQAKSEYQPSVDRSQLKDQADIQPYLANQTSRKQSPHFQKQPYFGQQKSISLQFQDTSPFQKKYIPWSYTPADSLNSPRYNITDQNIKQKKQVFNKLQAENKLRIQKYSKINQMLNEVKKSYTGCLDRLGEIRQQKRQFKIILKRLEQSNEIKQKQIEELIKKKKRAQQIKRKILQNQRLLYQRMKSDRRFRQSQINCNQKVSNKWDRFNKNLQRQRSMVQQQKTVSNFSYYA